MSVYLSHMEVKPFELLVGKKGGSFPQKMINYYHVMSRKINLFSVVPPTKSAQAISSIFSPNVYIGPNLQQSTTKMAVARLSCDAYS